MNEKDLEAEIISKGLNAPRVTPAMLDEAIVHVTYTILPSHRTTVCEITLRNGFTVHGLSSVVSIENFDAGIGRKVAYETARRQIWQLEGYRLQQAVFEGRVAV